MGVQTFHLYNVSGQGIVLSFYVNGVNLTHTINAGEDYEFEADSLSPETQNAIQLGYLVYFQGSAILDVANVKAGFPMVFRGNYYPTVKYKKGDLIIFNGSLWLCRADVYGQTPIDNPSAWVGFVTDLGSGNHQFNTNNPHATTAAQVGAIAVGERGASEGVAPLVGGKVPSANLPAGSTANGDTKLAEGTPNEVSAAALRLHLDSLNNPHQVTPAQIGAATTASIGIANGIAPLDAGGLVPVAFLPAASGGTGLVPVYAVANNTLRDALVSSLTAGSLVAVLSPALVWRWSGTAFTDVTSTSLWTFFVNGKTGPAVSLTTDDITEANGKYYFTDVRLAGSAAFVAVQAASHAINTDTKLAEGTGNEVTAAQLKAHLTSTANPHSVTAAQIGALTSLSQDVAPTLGNAMDAGGYRIFNMGTPTGANDAATKAYVDAIATIAVGGGVLTVNGRGGAVTLSISDVAATAADLRAAITGTSGTGNLVFGTGPVISGGAFTNGFFTAPELSGPIIVGNIKQVTGYNAISFSASGVGVNYIDVMVASTGVAPKIAATGTDSNIQLRVEGKGLSGVKIRGLMADSLVVDTDQTLSASLTGIAADASGGDLTLTLPSAVSNAGKIFFITKFDGSANVVNIASSDYINGTIGETVLEEQWQSYVLQAVGGEWVILASHGFGGGGGAAANVYAFFDTGSHTLTNETVISVECSSGPVNLTLPGVADVVGVPITVQRTLGGTTAPALVYHAMGESIEDYPGGFIQVDQGESATFLSDGTVWKLISNLTKVVRTTGDQLIQDEKTFTNLTAEGFSTGTTVLTSATTLDLDTTTVDASAVTASFVITLPDPTTCEGKLYVIYRSDGTAARYVRITTPVGSIEDTANFDLSYARDSVSLQAIDGLWKIVSSSLTTQRRRILDECVANHFVTFNGQTGLGIGNDATTFADYPHVRNANAGSPVRYTADGGSSNIDVLIEGKGTGVARAATATLGTSTTQIASTAFVTATVAAAVNGLSWKGVCRAATTAPVTLASGLVDGVTIDGVVLATGDRVLVKDQSAGEENGIYIVAASGAASRASDADTGAKLVNASVYVAEGTVSADKQYTCTTNAPITLGSTTITFTNFAAGTSYINGTGLLLTGQTFSINTAVVMDLTTAQTASNKTFSDVTLTGVPVAPTATLGTNTTQVATTAFVEAAIDAIDLDTIPVARLAFSTTSRVAVTGSIALDDATHDGKSLRCSSAGASTITIENTVRDGFTAIIHQDGAGVFTVATSTLTLRNADGVISTGGQWTSIIAERKGTDLIITGAIAANGSTLNEIALTNMTKLTLSSVCYVEITASRAITDSDNGKILYTTSASNFILTFPDSLTKPFGCTLKQEGTGYLTVAVSGTAVLRSRALSTRTAGQWAMAAVDYRSGNDVVLTGDTIA